MGDAQVIDFAAEMRRRGHIDDTTKETQPKMGQLLHLHTEALRRMLDERGIPHKDSGICTYFPCGRNVWRASEREKDGTRGLILTSETVLSAEQVMAMIHRTGGR